MESRIRRTVETLCSEQCAGRRPGTPGSDAARAFLRRELEALGLQPYEQPVPASGATNLLVKLPGRTERWVLAGAHYDHLGRAGRGIFHGADDNAAAVAVLLEVARALVQRPAEGRGVLLAFFDAEEPPHFLGPGMGSEHWARHPDVPLAQLDLMLCMDLVGHALGPQGAPRELRQLLFALGAERSEGTAALVDRLRTAERDVTVRRVDAEVIPPLSDYWAFWQRRVPFVFLTCGRWRHYHTPEDTPEKLDYPKVAATARWLERFVRESCARPEAQVRYTDARDDRATLESVLAMTAPLAALSPQARQVEELARSLLPLCDASGRAPEAVSDQTRMLVGMLEQSLG
jgi:hypothetical protein